MLFGYDEFINVLLTFDFLLLQLFRYLLVDQSDPGFGFLVEDAEFWVQIQILNFGCIDN